ncbi:hypothetical protein C7212DRAFT_292883 [Tuber magnatum]|uniref:Uncharacterized protein n=1 Tax=Tuber magnatum TaxID=42249 RepID=A0A317SSU5_9PEZI|nr:hypothetical protein C7212DRAFT_292883 [Tuber magnatum]
MCEGYDNEFGDTLSGDIYFLILIITHIKICFFFFSLFPLVSLCLVLRYFTIPTFFFFPPSFFPCVAGWFFGCSFLFSLNL